MTSADDHDAIYIVSSRSIDGGSLWLACRWPASRNPSISARHSSVSGSGEQLVQVRGADGLDQVSLDPHLAREFAAGVLAISRQGNQSQVL